MHFYDEQQAHAAAVPRKTGSYYLDTPLYSSSGADFRAGLFFVTYSLCGYDGVTLRSKSVKFAKVYIEFFLRLFGVSGRSFFQKKYLILFNIPD